MPEAGTGWIVLGKWVQKVQSQKLFLGAPAADCNLCKQQQSKAQGQSQRLVLCKEKNSFDLANICCAGTDVACALIAGADLILQLEEAALCYLCSFLSPTVNQETAQVIQAAFRNAKFPNITGERSVRLLGKVAYGLSK